MSSSTLFVRCHRLFEKVRFYNLISDKTVRLSSHRTTTGAGMTHIVYYMVSISVDGENDVGTFPFKIVEFAESITRNRRRCQTFPLTTLHSESVPKSSCFERKFCCRFTMTHKSIFEILPTRVHHKYFFYYYYLNKIE